MMNKTLKWSLMELLFPDFQSKLHSSQNYNLDALSSSRLKHEAHL